MAWSALLRLALEAIVTFFAARAARKDTTAAVEARAAAEADRDTSLAAEKVADEMGSIAARPRDRDGTSRRMRDGTF